MTHRHWDRLGAQAPVVAFTHSAACCAAVTNAGGIGVLGATSHTPEELEEDLAFIERAVDGRPYGVDLLIPASLSGASDGGADYATINAQIPDGHRRFVDTLLAEHGVPPLPERPKDGWDPALMLTEDPAAMVSTQNIRELVEITLRHPGVKLLASALGVPPVDVIDRCHDRDVLVAALGGAPEHAARQVDAGIDLLIAQGTEAGGHTGEIATMVLVPQVVEIAGDVPVLAAGGIGSGRQMAAAMALGASGVWTGSMWLVADEAVTSPAERARLLEARSSETIRSRSRTGKTCRMLTSEWTRAFDAPDAPDPLGMPHQLLLASEPLARIVTAADAGNAGAYSMLSGICGQVVGSLREERPAAELLDRLLRECAATFDEMAGLASSDWLQAARA